MKPLARTAFRRSARSLRGESHAYEDLRSPGSIVDARRGIPGRLQLPGRDAGDRMRCVLAHRSRHPDRGQPDLRLASPDGGVGLRRRMRARRIPHRARAEWRLRLHAGRCRQHGRRHLDLDPGRGPAARHRVRLARGGGQQLDDRTLLDHPAPMDRARVRWPVPARTLPVFAGDGRPGHQSLTRTPLGFQGRGLPCALLQVRRQHGSHVLHQCDQWRHDRPL